MPADQYLVINRHLEASPEITYRAWSEPAQLKLWWGPNESDDNERVEADVRVGGSYRIVTYASNGDRYTFKGQYREVDPNQKISFTWSTGAEAEGSIVTVEIEGEDDGGGVELTLTHEGLATEEERDGCRKGWEGAIEKLERLVEMNYQRNQVRTNRMTNHSSNKI